MYEYKATLTNIVDADTFDFSVDIGFSITINHRFRIKDFDAPETWRPKSEEEKLLGQKATEFAKGLLWGKELVLRSYKLGIYGRYECAITLPDGRDFATVMKENGFQKV